MISIATDNTKYINQRMRTVIILKLVQLLRIVVHLLRMDQALLLVTNDIPVIAAGLALEGRVYPHPPPRFEGTPPYGGRRRQRYRDTGFRDLFYFYSELGKFQRWSTSGCIDIPSKGSTTRPSIAALMDLTSTGFLAFRAAARAF